MTGGNLTLNLGNGTNTVDAGVNVNGTKVAVTTGIGTDSISFTGSATKAAVAISLGAGADDLVATLANALSGRYDGGAGLDHFRPTTLTGEPVVVLGFEDFS